MLNESINGVANATFNNLPYGLNPSAFMSGSCDYNKDGMYVEIFRVIGLYPKILLFFAGSLLLLSLLIMFFRSRWKWVDDYVPGLMGLFAQFSAALTFLLLPVTLGLNMDGLKSAYVVVQVVVYGLLLLGTGWVVWKIYKNRGRIEEWSKKIKIDEALDDDKSEQGAGGIDEKKDGE